MAVDAKSWPGFVEHASIQAIEWHLAEAERRRSRVEGEVNRLRALAFQRRRQIENGEWPPPAPLHVEDGNGGEAA